MPSDSILSFPYPISIMDKLTRQDRATGTPISMPSRSAASAAGTPGHARESASTQLRHPTASTDGLPRKDSSSTQFTDYQPGDSRGHSTGFNKARQLAQAALQQQGKLLKKRFVLEEILGQGGMGVVYKARDLRRVEAEDDNPYIAAKVLSQSFKDHPNAFVTLQQEAVKSQKLAHPNIVTVYDFDRDGSTIFMTMELLDGAPLDRFMREQAGGISRTQALILVQDICAALSYAHARGLVHADLKPSNIFVTAAGRAKVLDFGIARAVSREMRHSKFDVAELAALTPAYATKEMIDGAPPEFSDDVYALACVIYEIFGGRHPFARASAKEALLSALKPQRLDVLSRREWRALEKALAFDKQRRTPTVERFLDEFAPRKQSRASRIAVALTVTSVCAVALLAFQQQRARLQVAQTLSERLALAQRCMTSADFACAILHSRGVLALDTANAPAQRLLQLATAAQQRQLKSVDAQRLVDESRACLAANDAACARVKLDELLAQHPDHPDAASLRQQVTQAVSSATIQELLTQADACRQRLDLECASQFWRRANALNAQHPAVTAFAVKLNTARASLAERTALREAKVRQLLDDGGQCLARADLTCAQRNAESALGVDPASVAAIAFQQRVVVATEQQQSNATRAAHLLQQADACLQAGNFGCAILKSESALDLVPDHARALQLKQEAMGKQEQLKRSISIR